MTGLRELKKQRTKAAIQAAAIRLFQEKGFERTTCEQVAAAAEVSPATLFRYFTDKEALVFDDDYDPLIVASLERRPPGERLTVALRHAVREALAEVPDGDALIRARLQLALTVPALRARMTEQLVDAESMLSEQVGGRLGADPRSMRVRVVTSAVVAALVAGMTSWLDEGGELVDCLDEALRILERDLGPPHR